MNYMRVVINGESWGLYANAQQFNKDFTRDYFKSTKGARWKVPGSPGCQAGFNYLGDDPATYKQMYAMTSKDDPKAWTDLIKVFKVLNDTPPDTLEAALSPIFDVDGAPGSSPSKWRSSTPTVSDPRQRLQLVSGRQRRHPHHSARRERGDGSRRRRWTPRGGPGGFGPGRGPGGPPGWAIQRAFLRLRREASAAGGFGPGGAGPDLIRWSG